MTDNDTSIRFEEDVIQNPYLHFIRSEAWAALAALTIFTLSHVVAFCTQYVGTVMQLKNGDAPGEFLVAVMSWGASISSCATFVIISLYQVFVLIKRLKRQWTSF
jgi:hypothetical protein